MSTMGTAPRHAARSCSLPADKPRAIDKARTRPADVVVL